MDMSVPVRLRIYLVIAALVIVAGTIGLMALERLSLFDSVYFIVVTVATVGYGDIHPVTPAGRALVMLIILAGVGCFVGLVANVIEYMVDAREKRERLTKLNMIIGVFYSEVGTKLLRQFAAADPGIETIRSALIVSNDWSDADFTQALGKLRAYSARLDSRDIDHEELHAFLSGNKGFLLALLENPQVFEHERFTDLLHAVFHLAEELNARERLTGLPDADYAHLSGDINRVYGQLVVEWLVYMHHLKKKYPYLFSLAMRTNPFDADARVMLE
jgi:voltage-gated potassium channel